METLTTDIVPYFNSPSSSRTGALYTLNSPFYFHGYNGIESEKNLLKSIIDAAFINGTFLSYHRRTNTSKDRLVPIEIYCKRKSRVNLLLTHVNLRKQLLHYRWKVLLLSFILHHLALRVNVGLQRRFINWIYLVILQIIQ